MRNKIILLFILPCLILHAKGQDNRSSFPALAQKDTFQLEEMFSLVRLPPDSCIKQLLSKGFKKVTDKAKWDQEGKTYAFRSGKILLRFLTNSDLRILEYSTANDQQAEAVQQYLKQQGYTMTSDANEIGHFSFTKGIQKMEYYETPSAETKGFIHRFLTQDGNSPE